MSVAIRVALPKTPSRRLFASHRSLTGRGVQSVIVEVHMAREHAAEARDHPGMPLPPSELRSGSTWRRLVRGARVMLCLLGGAAVADSEGLEPLRLQPKAVALLARVAVD